MRGLFNKGLSAAVLMLACVQFAGCASYTIYVHDDEEENNHYVLLKTLGAREWVYDCYSKPEGRWDPTCVQVAMRRAARGD